MCCLQDAHFIHELEPCIEILSILLLVRNNKGITIDGTEYLISLYADDTTY